MEKGIKRNRNKKAIEYNKSINISNNKKMCSSCDDIKSLDLFYKDENAKFKVSPICKLCSFDRRGPRNEKNNIAHKKRRLANIEEYNKKSNLRSYKRLGLNISSLEYDNLHISQEGKCAICKISETSCRRKLSLDHDHTTIKIRGFLCDDCNIGLGKFKDNIVILTNAINYLIKHG